MGDFSSKAENHLPRNGKPMSEEQKKKISNTMKR